MTESDLAVSSRPISGRIDVIGQKDIIIPRLEEELLRDERLWHLNRERFLRLGSLGSSLSEAEQDADLSGGISETYAGQLAELKEEFFKSIEGHMNSEKDLADELADYFSSLIQELGGTPLLAEPMPRGAQSINARITQRLICGFSPLSFSISPDVRDSFVIGYNPLIGNEIASYSSPEEYAAFIKVEKDVLSKKPKRVARALYTFGQLTQPNVNAPQEQPDPEVSQLLEKVAEDMQRWFSTDPGHAHSIFLNKLYSKLPQSVISELGFTKGNGRYIMGDRDMDDAVTVLVFIAMGLRSGDTYNVHVDNSVVFGGNYAGCWIKGGTITNSIIAGRHPLTDANVMVKNSYVIGVDGAYFIGDRILGNPDVYGRVPAFIGQEVQFPPETLLR